MTMDPKRREEVVALIREREVTYRGWSTTNGMRAARDRDARLADLFRDAAEMLEADGKVAAPLEAKLHAANERILALEVRLRAIALAGKHLALATPDKVLRLELERTVKLANEVLPKDGGA